MELQGAEFQQAFCQSDEHFFVAARLPSQDPFGFFVAGFPVSAQHRDNALRHRIEQGRDPDEPTALSQLSSWVRSAFINSRLLDAVMPASDSIRITCSFLSRERSVVLTLYPCSSSWTMQWMATNPLPPVMRTKESEFLRVIIV